MEEWEYKELGEISVVKRGASPRPIQDPKWWGGNIGWVRISDVTSSNKYLYQTKDYLSPLGVSQSVRIQKNDVILSICATIGRPIITKIDVCIHDGFVWFDNLQKNINKEYLYYFLRFKENEIASNRQTGTQGNLNTSIVSKIKIPIPLIAEQTLIAEILSTVDRAIEQTEALIAKQQRIKTGLMQDLLTKGIDTDGNIRSEATHAFKDSPLGRIPVEWEIGSWEEYSEHIQDGTHFSPKTDPTESVKYITSKNIKFGYIDLSEVQYIDQKQHESIYRGCPVKKGDVLLTKDGVNTGNAAINSLNEEFSLLSSVAFIRTKQSKLLPEFLLHFILSREGQRIIKDAMSGLAITRVTLEIINSFLIKLPQIEEQIRIVSVLNSIDVHIKFGNNRLRKLLALKTGLMQDLLTGRVRVTELLKNRETEFC